MRPPSSGGTTNFLHTDWLGSRRVATGPTGSSTDTCTGLPFGDGINCVGTEPNFNRFTDYVHDPESNLEHSLFRQYSSTQGRFMSPDPYHGSMDLGNPQSMNRYPYVGGNPINFTDPVGLDFGGGDCTLFDGSPGEAFACASWSWQWGVNSGQGGGIGGVLGKILGSLNGSGLGGGTIPGSCFLPGSCPSLGVPSIWDFLPKMPQPGCDPGPCTDNPQWALEIVC
ncbi:MAG: RHS repeat-associated core domain-containing protein [Acidobacteriia bacterium]|nr:RHS repeat-associated core domain-containing protein [Terriglobia bacterium]